MAVARMHVRSWQAGYRGLISSAFLDGLRPEDRASRYQFGGDDPESPRTMLAIDEERVVGLATIAASRSDDLPGWGELFALYVDPEWWGRGVGRELIGSARAHLREMGFRKAMLWVLVGNARAERFYRADGWAPDGVERRITIMNLDLDELRYVRSLEESV